MQQIEIFERESTGTALACVVDDSLPEHRRMLFRSPTWESRDEAIQVAQDWAVKEIGNLLPISEHVEIFMLHGTEPSDREREPRRAHDPSYGKSSPLTTKMNWTLNE